jgi:Leucine-rich repeat (LRR) protein
MMQLPDSIGNAVNLVEFHAAGNGISQLPGSM